MKLTAKKYLVAIGFWDNLPCTPDWKMIEIDIDRVIELMEEYHKAKKKQANKKRRKHYKKAYEKFKKFILDKQLEYNPPVKRKTFSERIEEEMKKRDEFFAN